MTWQPIESWGGRDETVREIRDAYARGISWEALASEYGIGKAAIGRLLQRKTYADVL